MKEQVKEWIVDKNLTTDSFDSIMIGVIYNSEHSTLDDPDVRKWIEMHPDEFRGMLPPKLTDDQQVVLEWLKEAYKRTKWSSPFGTVYSTINTHELFVRTRLTKAQQYQVLASFAEWGMKEVAE
ncbi:hypothetical protein [Enterococcus avium]|uniref:hypothetical protein n=1 Tax=Enterococcus avium TaxID=33945 RepID=UPI00288FB4A1|nr:hypothetical protein [Enterococcus avium]MDT2461850.1 hypothetical protein [Enterococcus avium]